MQKQGPPEGSHIVNGKLDLANDKKRASQVSVKVSEKRSRDCCCDSLRQRVSELEKKSQMVRHVGDETCSCFFRIASSNQGGATPM